MFNIQAVLEEEDQDIVIHFEFAGEALEVTDYFAKLCNILCPGFAVSQSKEGQIFHIGVKETGTLWFEICLEKILCFAQTDIILNLGKSISIDYQPKISTSLFMSLCPILKFYRVSKVIF